MARKPFISRINDDNVGKVLLQDNAAAIDAINQSASELENWLNNEINKYQTEVIPEKTTSTKESNVTKKATEVKKEVKQEEKKNYTVVPKKENKPRKATPVKSETYLEKKRGRKKIREEETERVFGAVGKICYEKMQKSRKAEKKTATQYLIDLVKREKEAYEKNPESYAASRRKKAEALFKAGDEAKGSPATITIITSEELASFIRDTKYEVDCSQELFIRAMIEMDYDKKFK